jgi:hypothetical protein
MDVEADTLRNSRARLNGGANPRCEYQSETNKAQRFHARFTLLKGRLPRSLTRETPVDTAQAILALSLPPAASPLVGWLIKFAPEWSNLISV